MMNFKKTCLISAGLAVLSPFAMAADQVDQQDQNGNSAYVGSNGRIGIGYDTKTNLRGDAYWVFSEKDLAAWIGEGWVSRSAGGLKLNYQWVPGGQHGLSANASVHKLFAAIDQNENHDQKLTLGGGLERENIFFGGYFSAGVSGKRTISGISSTATQTISGTEPDGRQYTQDIVTTTSNLLTARPYDYGIGARVGRYFNQPLIRLTGGLDYEWGRDSNHQTTVSMKLEKFIAHTPHSFSVDAELYDQSGTLDQNPGNKRLFFMYHYEFGGKNYRPEHPYHMVEAPAADTSQPAETTVSPAPAAPVDSTPRIEKRMVKTTASMNSDAFFEFDKSRLTPAAKAALDSVIATLKKSGYSGNIHVTGHTCDIGTVEYNQKLSERRALSVKKYLVENGGIPADDIFAEGKGELNPTYPNVRGMRPKNRRVDLEFVTFADKMEEVVLPAEPSIAQQAPSAVSVKPAKVEWVREFIDVEPAWLRRALHNTLPHKESVDVYHLQETTVAVANGDRHYVLNHPPVIRDDVFTIGTFTPSPLNVLANDTDPDGDALTIVSFTQPSTGTISLGSNGNLIFTPTGAFPMNQFTRTTFSYTVSDGKGGFGTATVTLIDA